MLASEGVNGTIAAPSSEAADAFLAHMRCDPRFSDIDFKPSGSEKVPFHRMHVKVKREIVTMGKEGIDPAHFTGKYVEPLELKAWLDAGEEVVLVDTRNGYEVRLGTFRGALDPGIQTFRTFPRWVEDTLGSHKNARIVTFCTGGIRCEKATAFMRQNGFEDVWQLRGGILKYFEDVARPLTTETSPEITQATEDSCGKPREAALQQTLDTRDTHYKGHCFVFDYRVAVDQSLAPSNEHALCYACRAPLSSLDLTSPLYVLERQCPYCAEEVCAREAAEALRREQGRAAAQARRQERRAKAKALRSQGVGTSQVSPVSTVPDGHAHEEPVLDAPSAQPHLLKADTMPPSRPFS